MQDTIIRIEASFDSIAVSEYKTPIRHLILILHGIYSNSDRWLKFEANFGGRFADIDVIIRPISYSVVDVIQLIFGIGEKKRIKFIEQRIESVTGIVDYDIVSIQCHSYGTKLFSNLPHHIHNKFEWIFFAGSICHSDDDVKFESKKYNIINDCGKFDIFPILLASIMKNRFSPTGVNGFNNPPVVDRYHRYGHSRAVSVDHFSNWIMPIIKNGQIELSYENPPSRFILYAPKILRYSYALFLILLFRYLYYHYLMK